MSDYNNHGPKGACLPEEFWISVLTLRNYAIKYLPQHYWEDIWKLMGMEHPERNLWGAIIITGDHLDHAIEDKLLQSLFQAPKD